MPRREPRHAFIAPERLPIRAFAPFLRSLRQTGADDLILEKDPAALKPLELPFFRPAALTPEVIPQADVLLITGTTLINETLARPLGMAKPTGASPSSARPSP